MNQSQEQTKKVAVVNTLLLLETADGCTTNSLDQIPT